MAGTFRDYAAPVAWVLAAAALTVLTFVLDSDVFGVHDAPSGRVGYCSVLGALGELGGMCVFVGDDGWNSYVAARDDTADEFDAPFLMQGLRIGFFEDEAAAERIRAALQADFPDAWVVETSVAERTRAVRTAGVGPSPPAATPTTPPTHQAGRSAAPAPPPPIPLPARPPARRSGRPARGEADRKRGPRLRRRARTASGRSIRA